jgi:hypothetical protein
MQADKQFDFYALLAVQRLAKRVQTFTSGDVLVLLENSRAVPAAKDMRRLGAVMRRAQRKGWILRTEQFTASKRDGRHAGPERVWCSLVFRARIERMNAMPLFTGEAQSCAVTI